ncbi:hypothetical protein [Streptomyces sp. NPDC051183]|uniref:hypothetical protein n=1 Tax=unclassified Streptomyces TaxID=2593676 RepID=UPI0034315347
MRHVPLFRWVLTLGFVFFTCSVGLYAAGSEMSASRQIDLTVLEEEPDGSCRVRWIDPYQKRAREAAYDCDADRADSLKAPQYPDSRGYGWATGFMFTEGPDRGELEDLGGESDLGASDVFLLLGAPLITLGLIGGNLRALPRVLGAEPRLVRRAARLSGAARCVVEDYERAVEAVREAGHRGALAETSGGGSDARLVTALWLLREAGPQARETAALGRGLVERMAGPLRDAAPASGVRSMLRAGPGARRSAVRATGELRLLLADAEREGLPERFAQASVDLLRGQDADLAALAAGTDFEREPAAYRELLAQLTGAEILLPAQARSSRRGRRRHGGRRHRRPFRLPFGIFR